MSNGCLDPLRQALDTAQRPVTFFFRDDDVGWGNTQLFVLLDLFAEHELPIDLAVIPQALIPPLATQILARVETTSARIGLHQHGFAHINHQASGRKCEFGSERSPAVQYTDIACGQLHLRDAFGEYLDPIFTPPWNRCMGETGQCLLDLGFRVLSRERGASPLNLLGLAELPVSIDWFARHKGVRLSREEFGRSCATAVTSGQPIGVMFHHARMDRDECHAAREFLSLLAAHPFVRCRPMEEL
jgi:hypothetical protein